MNELEGAVGPQSFFDRSGKWGPGGLPGGGGRRGAGKLRGFASYVARLKPMGGAREAGRAAPRNSGCGQAAGARDAERAAAAEQPSSGLCILESGRPPRIGGGHGGRAHAAAQRAPSRQDAKP